MNTEIIAHSRFVSPHFIPELGEEGLTLHEIARSLGIQFKHAKEALEKNLGDYSAVEISTQQEIQEVTGHSYTRTTASYALTTEDAKFFVAGYNNEVGKSYRRFLIQCEKALLQIAQRMALSPYAKARDAFENTLAVYELLGVPRHLAEIESAKEAQRYTGIDFSPGLQLSPAQDNIKLEERMLEPTELALELGYDTAQKMNRALAAEGLQVKNASKNWVPTEEGKKISTQHSWKRDGKSGYNLKWNVEKVKEILFSDDVVEL